MQKIRPLFLAFVALVFIGSFIYASKTDNPIKNIQPEGGGTDHVKVTLDMLNCKPGLYKTYQDFLDGKPVNLIYVRNHFTTNANKKLIEYHLEFKDESGKSVTIEPGECWGYTNNVGELCRWGTIPFKGLDKPINFVIEYATNSYISYIPGLTSGQAEVWPRQWISEDLNSPIIDEPTYFKSHDKAPFKKFEDYKMQCLKTVKRERDQGEWAKKLNACYVQSPDLIGLYAKDKGVGGNKDPGRYIK